MNRDEALLILRASAGAKEMGLKIELQRRDDLPLIIRNGYFDPILAEIIAAVNDRSVRLREATAALAATHPLGA